MADKFLTVNEKSESCLNWRIYCNLLTDSFHLQGHSIEGIQEELQRQDRQPMEPQSTKPLLSGCPLWPQEICQLLEIAQFCMADFWIQIWYLSSVFFGRLCSNSSKFFQPSFYIWVQPLFDSCRTFWPRTFSTPRFKVENILKGSLDSILSPSPSVKILIYGRESLLEG